MRKETRYMTKIALIAALGGFLMGFDASVISGVVGYIEVEFALTKIELGWSASSLALAATFAMMMAGPVSDRIGRRPVLQIAAVLFAVSALVSALTPNFIMLVAARMIGGLGVGAALIIAPMYIAEMSPPESRGRLVSFNQFNIVIGISAAFFSNYLVLRLGQSDLALNGILRLDEYSWRWMLGIEMLPAILYLAALRRVPESPRWLVMHGRDREALGILERVGGSGRAAIELEAVQQSIASEAASERVSVRDLFQPSLRLVITIGLSVGILQQITGINSVFYYAPMIFEQSGIGTNASFMQAILVGLVNVVFTVVAMVLIDRIGRKLLLGFGLAGIAASMLTLAYGFGSATYTLNAQAIEGLPAEIDKTAISALVDTTYWSDVEFREAVAGRIGKEVFTEFESPLVSAAIELQPLLILLAILGFVASFAVSIGPVMWVLFSELFPNRIRGMAISFVGLVNSATAFGVTFLFPWELETFGNAITFLLYGLFALGGLLFVMRLLPETKGKSLEQLEKILVRA